MANETTRWIYKLLRCDSDALQFIGTIEDKPQDAIRDAMGEYLNQIDLYQVEGIDLNWIAEAIVYDSHRWEGYLEDMSR